MVEARGIHKYFGHNHVLRGVDLTVRKGEVVVIVGPAAAARAPSCAPSITSMCRTRAGCGSTATLLGYRAGTTDMLAVSDATLSEQRRQIGMVFQQFNLFSHMTALDNVMAGPVQVLRVGKAKAAEEARRCWRWSGWRTRRHPIPSSSPAVSSSGWRSPVRWRCTRR
jgi:polar amino acid transport system ATP-binding protein